MRLEDGPHLVAGVSAAHGVQSRLDLRRVVSVVVDHRHLAGLAGDGEAPLHAAKLGQRLAQVRRGDVEFGDGGHRRQGIEDVVPTREARAHQAEELAGVERQEVGAAGRVGPDFFGMPVGVGRQPVGLAGQTRPRQVGGDRILAADDQAILDEFKEGLERLAIVRPSKGIRPDGRIRHW